jgi:glycosyltransferase involved in cell wall biosynthesis
MVVAATPKAGAIFTFAGWVTRVPIRIYFSWGLRLETTRGTEFVVLWITERLTVLFSTKVLAVSQSLQRKYASLKLGNHGKVSLVGCGSSMGVDLSEFRPKDRGQRAESYALRRQLRLEPKIPVIGFFCRISEDKGLAVLAEARNILAANGIDHQLLVVGSNELGREPEWGSHPSLRSPSLAGYQPAAAQYYRLLDIFCLPSFREGLPNVCLEASASGIPVVTTNATGAIDSVSHGVTGLVVRTGSPTELAAALEKLISNRGLRTRLGSNARQWVSERFDSTEVQGLYTAYLAELGGN